MSKYREKYMESFTQMIDTIITEAPIKGGITKDEAVLLLAYKKELENYERGNPITNIINGTTAIIPKLNKLLSGIGGKQ
jgi:hypothetical protein